MYRLALPLFFAAFLVSCSSTPLAPTAAVSDLAPTDRRVFMDFVNFAGRRGRPDGCAMDSQGFLWVAEIDAAQLLRLALDGHIERTVPLPTTRPTSVAFGGEGLRTLFITSMTFGLNAAERAAQPFAGRLLGFEPGLTGLPELAVVDAADRVLPRGSEGELVCRPRNPYIMMQGYLKRPEAAAAVWRNLWYHTGDYMRQDEEGYFYFAGRDKDRIRRRGENISPVEIETELRSHPAFADCVALAHPGANGEDEIRAVIVLRPGVAAPTFHELAAWLAARLPKSMLPRYYEYAASLPLTATDKVDRRALREAGLGTTAWDREQKSANAPAQT